MDEYESSSYFTHYRIFIPVANLRMVYRIYLGEKPIMAILRSNNYCPCPCDVRRIQTFCVKNLLDTKEALTRHRTE